MAISYESSKLPIKKKNNDKIIAATEPVDVLPMLTGGAKDVATLLNMPNEELARKIFDVIKIKGANRTFSFSDVLDWLHIKTKTNTPVYSKLYTAFLVLIKSKKIERISKGKFRLLSAAPVEKPVRMVVREEGVNIYERALDLLSAIKNRDVERIRKFSPELAILIEKGIISISF